MQIFRLIKAGYVDKMIAFDELPERFLKGVKYVELDGLPRHWKSTATHISRSRIDKYSKLPIEETFDIHYGLEYDPNSGTNQDIDRWKEITQFCKKACDLNQRLTDNLEDMAIPMAPDSHAPISIEPEDIPVIHIPLEFQEKHKLEKESNEQLEIPKPTTVTIAPQNEAVTITKVLDTQESPPPEIVEIKAISAQNPEPIKAEIKKKDKKCIVCGKEVPKGMYFHMRSHNKVKAVA